jgi:teichuronic acid biosynthesis glycosyltransferase TuaC
MLEIGVDESSAHVFRNGVDLKLFAPLARDKVREKWQVKSKLLISVGYLIERKGHHLTIEAMSALQEYQLFIVGGGEWENKLKSQVLQLGLQDRVRFLGEVSQKLLPELYNCADALVLASDREGWANVLLEAMACGTPVVASNIWGTPEVVQSPDAGVLYEERSAKGIVEGVNRLFNAYPDRQATREYAEKFSWDETTNGLVDLFSKIKQDID